MKILNILLLSLLLLSCTTSPPQDEFSVEKLEGIWMGGAYQLDVDYYLPYSLLTVFEGGNNFFKKEISKPPDSLEYIITENEIIIDQTDTTALSNIQIPKSVRLVENRGRFTIFQHKVIPSSKVSKDTKISDLLVNNYWQNEEETLFFGENGTFKQWLRDSTGHLSYCYELDSYKDIFLLSKKGNQNNCASNHQFLEQVLEITPEKLVVFRWNNDDFETVVYKSVAKNNKIKDQSVDFQLCNKYLNRNFPRDRYYAVQTLYDGGIYEINKVFSSKYEVPDVKESGLIRVLFVVNCEGQTEMFEMIELDNDYKEKKFDLRISEQILAITKELTGWIPGTWKDNPADAYKFLTFKIKESEITEIFP